MGSSLDRSVAWLWLIEYIASFQQLHPSILHDLVSNGPDDLILSKNITEMVALRCLEHLFGPSPTNAEAAATHVPSSTISCLHVLQSILQKTSVADLKMVDPHLFLGWDIRPFIAHKRASIPNSALQQLKDTILLGIHSHAAFLMQYTGLQHSNNGCNASSPAPNSKHENNTGMMGGDSSALNLLPVKRKGSYSTDKSLSGDFQQHQGCVNAKRPRQDASPVQRLSFPQPGHELAEDSSKKMVGASEKESHYMENECGVVALEECRSLEDEHGKFVAVNSPGQSPDADANDKFHHNQCEYSHSSNNMAQDTSRNAPHQHILLDKGNEDELVSNNALFMRSQEKFSMDEAKNNREQCDQRNLSITAFLNGPHSSINVAEAECALVHLCEESMLSDVNHSYHEKVDLAMKKSQLLTSQCTPSHDSLEAADWTEQNPCVICCKDSPVLVCSAVGCPLVFHEGCLGSSLTFDEKGYFICPSCAYSRNNARHLQARKDASLASKELTAFIRNPKEYTE